MNGEGKTSHRHRAVGPNSKNRSLWIMFVVALGLACSCGLVAAGIMVPGKSGPVLGSGTVKTENRPVGRFERVSISDIGTLIISQADGELLTVETDDNLMRSIETRVQGGTLVLSLSHGAKGRAVQPSKGLIYRLTVRDITGLEAADSGRIQAPALKVGTLEVKVQDSGEVEINTLTAHSLQVCIEDSGDVRLAGSVEKQDVAVQDSSHYLASHLYSRTAAVVAGDSAEATLWATEALDATVRDSARVHYHGDPERTRYLFDNGRLIGLGAP